MENKTFSTQEELSLNEMTQITAASGVNCSDLNELYEAYRNIEGVDAQILRLDVFFVMVEEGC